MCFTVSGFQHRFCPPQPINIASTNCGCGTAGWQLPWREFFGIWRDLQHFISVFFYLHDLVMAGFQYGMFLWWWSYPVLFLKTTNGAYARTIRVATASHWQWPSATDGPRQCCCMLMSSFAEFGVLLPWDIPGKLLAMPMPKCYNVNQHCPGKAVHVLLKRVNRRGASDTSTKQYICCIVAAPWTAQRMAGQHLTAQNSQDDTNPSY